MTDIVVTKDVVRRLSAAMSATDTTLLKHTDRIALIADAFGWRPDAFMHALKTPRANYGGPRAMSRSPDDVDLSDLSMGQVDKWKRVLSRKKGICFVCGCTGSGRTTTLVASIKHLQDAGRAIFRRDYATCMTQSEGAVMVFGAVRDASDASEAFWMAERGFLVLATSALSDPSRLTEWLVEDCKFDKSKLAHMVGGVSQYLPWRRCGTCEGGGCASCDGGIKKRVLVSEICEFNTPADLAAYRRRGKARGHLFAEDLARLIADDTLTACDVEDNFGRETLEHVRRLLPARP
jgi:general secretion pathway protein E